MRILIINHNAGSPKFGMAFRPYYLGQEWLKKGVDVTIVAGTFSHIRKIEKTPGVEMHDGIRYVWIKTPRYQGNGISRIISMITFVAKLLYFSKKYAFEYKPDYVIASSTYPLDVYPARKIANISGGKFCFELHDLWPLSPMELGGYSKYHPFIVIMQHAEDYFCKYADKVVSIIPLPIDYLESRGLKKAKFFHVPNGIDTSDWEVENPLSDELKAKINNIKNSHEFIIGYAGAHGIANSLKTLIDAAVITGVNIAYVLVGDGPEKKSLISYCSQRGIKNVYFFDSIPKKQIPSLLKTFDILYIGLQKESLFRFGVSPNKIFDYMMAGKPIVQAINAGNNIVEDAKCGIHADADNPDAVAEAILKLCTLDLSLRDQLGQNGITYVLKHHTYSVLADKFLNALHSNKNE